MNSGARGGAHSTFAEGVSHRDIHALFDAGYVTITPTLAFEVSPRIKQEFENGRQYYAPHGQPFAVPQLAECRPRQRCPAVAQRGRFLG